jgi:nitroimidazol reductase NimA-like FMN-containing flavoprotein (pyridoxamine 5'-phosphate oxidase superfamily)
LSEEYTATEFSTVKRLPKRADYSKATINEILDEGVICHVGFSVAERTVVIPTTYVRVDEELFIHGSGASRMLKTLKTGLPVCVTVTLLDGIVLARSAFHHSMNYRSVVIFGNAVSVEEVERKLLALRYLTEHIRKGRWSEVRKPNDAELRQTLVLSIPLIEASAKIRTGPPVDDEEDYSLPVWAGVIPLKLKTGVPIKDERMLPGIVPIKCDENYKGQAVNI